MKTISSTSRRPAGVPDLIAPGLSILFAGANPGLTTAERGFHYSHPANRFWPTLHAAGFTPRRFRPEENQELLALGFGITNVVKRATATSAELTRDELRAGARRITRLATRYQPRFVAVVGVGVYRAAFDRPRAQPGPQDERIGPAQAWLLPDPSGLNAHFPPAKLAALFAALKNAALKTLS
jgi:TDG/mug DNA glycosylase family protein